MSRGEPLTDADRWPWLHAIAAWIAEHRAAGTTCVVTCSALKRAYRDIVTDNQRADVRLIYLKGDFDLIAARLAARTGSLHAARAAARASSTRWRSRARTSAPSRWRSMRARRRLRGEPWRQFARVARIESSRGPATMAAARARAVDQDDADVEPGKRGNQRDTLAQ